VIPDQRDMCMVRILAVWPRPPMADSQMVVWNEHLEKMAYEPAAAAIAYLEKNSKHRPALSEFHEAYAAQHHSPERALSRPACGLCENGRVLVRCVVCPGNCVGWERDGLCPNGPQTSTKCPNGCVPMSAEERAARDRAEDEQFERERRAKQEIRLDLRAEVRNPAESRHESEVF